MTHSANYGTHKINLDLRLNYSLAFIILYHSSENELKKTTQDYSFSFGLGPSSDILEIRNHNVSETVSVSVLR
jgi:hypothetical protein